MSYEDLLVPAGARVVHIGFNKTGTTSVQGALAYQRAELPPLGVVYPGRSHYHKMAGLAITGVRGRIGDRMAGIQDWDEMTEEVRNAGESRVMISSEWLCEATDEQARACVEGLGGGDTVHVLATLRPLTSILPSSWQQYLQNGSRLKFEGWLRQMLLHPPFQAPDTPSFWRRHQHDVVLARWASIVGPQNVTGIIVDPADHSKLFRQFEGLLGLPEGMLIPDPEGGDNRSLTWPEAEFLRHLNQAFRKQGWPDELYRSAVREGLVARLAALRAQNVSMPKVTMPQWALERAAEIGAGMAVNIGNLGIRVVGDLDSLGRLPAAGGGPNPKAVLPAEFVATVVAGMIDDRHDSEQVLRERATVLRERLALRPPPPRPSRPLVTRVLRLPGRVVRKAKRELGGLRADRSAAARGVAETG